MKKIAPLFLLLAATALTGCHAIKAHNPFRHKEPAYKAAQQERPLQVPPGMNQPPTTEALVIPNAGNGADAIPAEAPASSAQPAADAPPATAPRPAAQTAATGNSLTLPDTPDNAYQKVGRALARGALGQVSAHAAEHSYQVAVTAATTEKPQADTDALDLGSDKTASTTVTVSVAALGNGSVVEVSGDPGVAARVFAVLRQNLQ